MEQQTAVEWYAEQDNLALIDFLEGKINKIELLIIKTTILQQAKAIHKEEIMNAHNQGYADGYRDNGISPIDYYNQTFKTK